jgi:acetylglutamate kinase
MATERPPPVAAEPNAAAALPAAAGAVLTFLESVSRPSEVELYLKLFRNLPKESFAIIAPGAPVIRQGLGGFAEQLRFLTELGLTAPIVLGLFDPREASAQRERFVRRLTTAGLDVTLHGPAEADLVETLRDGLGRGRWPVVQLEDEPLQTRAERLAWLARLAEQLDTRKLVFARRRGPLRLENERSIGIAEKHLLSVDSRGLSLVNLRTDAALLAERRLLRRSDRALFEHVQTLLGSCADENLLVSIASPLDLLRELFTVKGSGTLVKRGTLIQRFDGYSRVDRARLELLLESSFGHDLREGFFSVAPLAVYVEQDYRGAAIVHDTPDAPYLAKFSVDPVAQGEGMGRDLWQALSRDFPRLFWRTRAENPISAWYCSMCDGLMRMPGWHVFWRGVEPELVPRLVAHALARGDDFHRPPSSPC